MSEQHRKVEAELQRDKVVYNSFSQTKAALEAENNRLTESIMRQQYVFVLIDGNSMIVRGKLKLKCFNLLTLSQFHDQLLNDAASGGRQAAQLLHDSTQMYVDELLGGQLHFTSGVKVVARMYADLHQLADRCHKAGVVPSIEHVLEFASGFTTGQVLFDFVDVGAGIERAHEKINGES